MNMNIVSPIVSTNNLVITPRYYESVGSNLVFLFENEDTKKALTHTIDSLVKSDGQLTFNVNADFKDRASYKVKVTDSDLNTTIYRGLIYATTQETQNYRVDE